MLLKPLLTVLVFIAATLTVAVAKPQLVSAKKLDQEIHLSKPPLYLPEAQYVRAVTFGFNNLASNILWFNTLNYFGKHFATDQDFRWFGHMCDLVTTLDPQADHAYDFCVSLLSWVVQEPEQSKLLLTRAIQAQPEHWRWRYLRGFTNWYFLEDDAAAKEDLLQASKLPNTPIFVTSLASRMLTSKDDPETAIAFLQEQLNATKDATARKALGQKLSRAIISKDRRKLETVIQDYEARTGVTVTSLEQLVQAGVLTHVPLDPKRKPYRYDPVQKMVISGKKNKGLEFFGKTSKTGIASKMR